MDGSGSESSRPASPPSPMTSSLYDATTTIDDLTTAIADLSHIPSPDPSTCCCGNDDCHSFRSWIEIKTKLNERLVLSAEVGQALLCKHDAYVRQTERRLNNVDQYSESDDSSGLQSSTDTLRRDFDELVREKAHLTKRLNQALVNSEVTEVSSKTILQELQEARDTISRLTSHNVRSVGWETRLSAALRERDDMQQERDEEMNRARLAESRFAALKEKTAKLQAEIRRLQESLEEKRLHRLESSEHLIQDARSRLASLRSSQLGVTAKIAEEELTRVLESMVHDNEVLKRDNAELQNLLAESREEIHRLQGELEEQRANPAPSRRFSHSGRSTPISRHSHTGSVPVINIKEFMFSPPRRRNQSAERRRRVGKPSINLRLSPGLSEPPPPDFSPPSSATLYPSDYRYGQRSPGASSFADVEEDVESGPSPTLGRPRTHRPLLLLARSRGVQTDDVPATVHSPTLAPSLSSTITAHDLRSESSSLLEHSSSPMGVILERVYNLFNSLSQADALTLTNRLKRQHLKGADVGHLSRTTVGNILTEVTTLRTQFRFLLEDEKVVVGCTRKDLRMFFKVVKDIFLELGQLRVAMNGIILDPSSAASVSNFVLNPEGQRAKDNGAQISAAAWIAPISKLFLPSTVVKSDSGSSIDRVPISQSNKPAVPSHNSSRPQKMAPKIGPALGASTTTVNVEFSGTGVGRAVTNTGRLQPTVSVPESVNMNGSSLSAATSSGVMGIFAGASHRPVVDPSERWVVLPSAPQSNPADANHAVTDSPYATVRRNGLRRNTNRLSRNVDAVIDIVEKQSQEEDEEHVDENPPPRLQRPLRRRGLSDSSIHSTFSRQAGDQETQDGLPTPSPRRNNITAGAAARTPAWRQPNSVFQAFSQWGMFSFRQHPAHAAENTAHRTNASANVAATSSSSRSSERRVWRDISATDSSVDESLIPTSTTASQATTTKTGQSESSSFERSVPSWDRDPFQIAGSLREESFMHPVRRML